MSTRKMHVNEVEINVALVGRLLAAQFPLPVARMRLGNRLPSCLRKSSPSLARYQR